ncbi:response regulator transcription factor [Adlercreutzia murintestinalis]|uniref:response regulator transcription factor n=1 Tax=Adlercreutzia murintestinalis TaxID=2941325 RepID=UPI00203B38F8|nr:response regulator transcription factor [Adlercreutzia murintestinalis]
MRDAALPTVLVVEDDAAINEVVVRRLQREGLSVTAAFSGTEARLLLDQRPVDLVICDLMLPGMMGEDVVRSLRDAQCDVSVIVISAKASAADKVALLGMGADDYLGKPFDLDELAARVQVQLRRRGATAFAAAHDAIRAGRWVIDRAAHTLSVDGRAVALTRTEFNMAELLASHPGRVFTKQQLFEHAQGEPYQAQSSTVNAHISNLRAKLKPTGTAEYIQTVWGIGFKFDAADSLKVS